MTRKDYIKFAAMLQSVRASNSGGFGDESVIDQIEDALCQILAEDNQLFDEDRFREAANYKAGLKCCICNKLFSEYGNNPYPVKDKGRCCDYCNVTAVIPARLNKIIATGGKK